MLVRFAQIMQQLVLLDYQGPVVDLVNPECGIHKIAIVVARPLLDVALGV